MNYQPQMAEISAQHTALNKVQAKEMKRIGRSNSYSVKLDANGINTLKNAPMWNMLKKTCRVTY